MVSIFQSGYGAGVGLTNDEGVHMPGMRLGALGFSGGGAFSIDGVEGRVGAVQLLRREK